MRATGAALVAAAAVVVALLASSTSGPTSAPSRASASIVLRRAALAADAQQPLVPGPGQFLYVRLLVGSRAGYDFFLATGPPRQLSRYYVQSMNQLWTAPSGPNRQTMTVVGQPQFITQADRSLWREAGSPPIESGYGSGTAPPYYDVTDLPTDPSKMAAYFTSQSDLPSAPADGRDGLWDFSTAASFLENGASATQRAALLEYMATIPGVSNDGTGTTLGTKETGTILSIPSRRPGSTYQAIIDPSTSRLLETRLVVSDPSALVAPTRAEVASGRAIAPLGAGQAESYVDFLYAGIADSSSAAPATAPAAPPAWPFGTGRLPVPGSAY